MDSSHLWVTSACKPVLIVSTSCAMFLASPYFSTSPSQPSLTIMSSRGFPKAARTGDAVMLLQGGILRLVVSQSQAGLACPDSGPAAAAALVLSIKEVEAARRAMLLACLPGNTKLCLATNRDITLAMTQSTVVRPQGAPWRSFPPSSPHSKATPVTFGCLFDTRPERDDFVISGADGH